MRLHKKVDNPTAAAGRVRAKPLFRAMAVLALAALPLTIPENAAPAAHDPEGILVGPVKTYDQSTLDQLLNNAESNLSKLNAFSSNVTNQLGQVQGATANQASLGVTVGTAPSQATSSTPTLPSTGASAVNFLNEELQLGLQAIDIQLMLNGAANDRAGERATFGFPIYISVPPGFKYQHAVAEVEISICRPVGSSRDPSLALLLPQEKTYNVASLVSKSASIGASATISGVLPLGGSFLHGHQAYYLVQDQDTLALWLPPEGSCSNGGRPVRFAWQFRPVLGQKVVRDGLRQTFAQVSFGPNEETGFLTCPATITVESGWRRYDPRTGRVGAFIDPLRRQTSLPGLGYLSGYLKPPFVVATDNGDGNITVVAHGDFPQSVRVRVGGAVQDATSSTFEQRDHTVRFVASASSLAASGASILVNGYDQPLIPTGMLLNLACPTQTQTSSAPSAANEAADRSQTPQSVSVTSGSASAPYVRVRPFSDTTSLLTIYHVGEKPPPALDVELLIIGSKLFGPSNAPFWERGDDFVSVVVDNQVLQGNRTVRWGTVLNQPKAFPIPSSPPDPSGFSDVTAKVTLISSSSSPAAPVKSDVSVTNPTAKGAGLVTIGNGTPAITSLSVARIQPGETVPVTITGAFTHFTAAVPTSTVLFSDPAIGSSPLSMVDGTHLTTNITVPSGAKPETVGVTVQSGDENATGGSFTVGDASALVSAVMPSGADVTDLTLTVTGVGTNFNQARSIVSFSDPDITIRGVPNVLSLTSLQVPVHIRPGASLMKSDVMVVTGMEKAAGTALFTVNPSAPVLTEVDPAALKAGQTSDVRIYGSNVTFTSMSMASFSVPGMTATDQALENGHLKVRVHVPPSPQSPNNVYAIAGTRLNGLRILDPQVDPDYVSDTLVTFSLTKDQSDSLKNILLEDSTGRRFIVPLTAPPAAPAQPPSVTVPTNPIPNSQTTLDLNGTGMQSVVSVRYLDQPLPFVATSDTALTVQKLPALAAPGIELEFVYADNSKKSYLIPVAK